MKRKWVPKTYSYLQCDEMADWLGTMASKGWRFSCFRFGFLFEKCQPMEDAYDVQVFLKNQEGDLAPNEDTLDFAQFCAAAGWELVDSKGRFVVFRQIHGDAVPIYTPPEKLDAVFRAEIKKRLWLLPSAIWFMVCILYFQFWTDFSLLRSFLRLFDPGSLLLCTWCALWFVSVIGSILFTLWWHRRKQAQLEKGGAFLCKTGKLPAAVSAAASAAGTVLLAEMLLLMVRAEKTADFRLTWNMILWFVLFAGVFGSLLRDEWQRPGRKEQERRQSIRLVVLILMLTVLFPWLDTMPGGLEDSGAGHVSEADPPLVLADLVQDLDGRDTEAYDMYAKRNVLGSCQRYSLYCPTPGFAETLREWEENQIGKTEEEIGEEPVDDGLVSLEWELSRTPYRNLAGFIWDRIKAPLQGGRSSDSQGWEAAQEKERWGALEAFQLMPAKEPDDPDAFRYCALYDTGVKDGRQTGYAVLYLETSAPLEARQIALIRRKLGL